MINRHDKFKAYWKEIGKPKLEVVHVGKNSWCDCISDPSFYDDANYRIANDRHFELRRKWIDSDKTLPVEWRFGDQYGYDQNDWKIGVPEWRQDCEYREAQVAEEINHPEYGVIRSYHDESALSTQVGGEHYKNMKIQPVEFITANNLGFIQGSVIKYISRYKSKNGKQDLEKAKHFIDLLIELEYGKQ